MSVVPLQNYTALKLQILFPLAVNFQRGQQISPVRNLELTEIPVNSRSDFARQTGPFDAFQQENMITVLLYGLHKQRDFFIFKKRPQIYDKKHFICVKFADKFHIINEFFKQILVLIPDGEADCLKYRTEV